MFFTEKGVPGVGHAFRLLSILKLLELSHFNSVNSTFVTFVAQSAAASVLCLLEVFRGQQSVDNGNVTGGVEAGNALCDTLTDVVEVWRLATNDTSQDDDGVITVVE